VTWPAVRSEIETLDLVLSGRSLARYGDGELTLAEGKSIVNQPRGPEICQRLRGILLGDGEPCLVGIPNILSKTPKAKFWAKYTRCTPLLTPGMAYASSFITRPDNAPWIDVPVYWQKLEAIWRGKDVTLVRGDAPAPHPKQPDRFTGAVSLVASDLDSAKSVTEIIGPSVNAWRVYDDLLSQIGRPSLALLCLGATATVMAVDLCKRGVHAIDLGHIGMFRALHLKGKPMMKAYR